MSPLIKIAAVATIGVLGYAAYRHYKTRTMPVPRLVAPKVVRTSVQPQPTPKTPAPMPSPVAEESHTVKIITPSLPPAIGCWRRSPAVQTASEDDDVTVLNIISGKRIIVQGVAPTLGRRTFTDGQELVVTPEMDQAEIYSVVELQSIINKHISRVVHGRTGQPLFTQKRRADRFSIRSYTEATLDHTKTHRVLVQITSLDGAVLSEYRTLYVLVERDELVQSTDTCAVGSEEWLAQTAVLVEHLLHGFQGLPNMTDAEQTLLLSMMREQFIVLDKRLQHLASQRETPVSA